MRQSQYIPTPADITEKDILYEDNHLIAINKRAGDSRAS